MNRQAIILPWSRYFVQLLSTKHATISLESEIQICTLESLFSTGFHGFNENLLVYAESLYQYKLIKYNKLIDL